MWESSWVGDMLRRLAVISPFKSRLPESVKKGRTAWRLQAVQFQLVVERLAVHTQQLGRLAFVAAGGLQGLQDALLLGVLVVQLQAGGGCWCLE